MKRNIHILKPNQQNNLNIAIKAYGLGAQRAKLHCVDMDTKKVLQRWLLEVESEKPMLQKQYEVHLVVGRHQPYKLPYTSQLGQEAIFEFVSSRPNLMQVRREKENFQTNETKSVDLVFPAQRQRGVEEAFLYVNEEGGRVSECFMFKIVVGGE